MVRPDVAHGRIHRTTNTTKGVNRKILADQTIVLDLAGDGEGEATDLEGGSVAHEQKIPLSRDWVKNFLKNSSQRRRLERERREDEWNIER
jgi:hypothetical protein